MVLELDIRIDSDYIHVRAKGLRNREGVIEIAKRILDVCDEYQQTKVLVDVREMRGRLGGLDSYKVASLDFPDIIEKGRFRVAIVDDGLFEDTPTFFERFAQEAGLDFRVFETTDKAVTWLVE